jgi:hypothetical protein
MILSILSLLVSVAFLIVFCIAVFRPQPMQQAPEFKITITTRTYTVPGNKTIDVWEER